MSDGLLVTTLTVEGDVTFIDGASARTTTVNGQLTFDTGGMIGDTTNEGTIVSLAETIGDILQNDGTIVASGTGASIGFGDVINSGMIAGSGAFGATTLDNAGGIDIASLNVYGTLTGAGAITVTEALTVNTTDSMKQVTLAGGLLNGGSATAFEVLAGSNGGVSTSGLAIVDAGATAAGINDYSQVTVAAGATLTSNLFVSGKATMQFAGTGVGVSSATTEGTLDVASGATLGGSGGSSGGFIGSFFDVDGSATFAGAKGVVDIEGGAVSNFALVDVGNGATINIDGSAASMDDGEFDVGTLNNTSTVGIPFATINLNGGTIVTPFMAIGFEPANAKVVVNGGVALAGKTQLRGQEASSVLLIENGGSYVGTVVSVDAQSGALGSGSSTITVDGSGAFLGLSVDLIVGASTGGTAIVSVQNGASAAIEAPFSFEGTSVNQRGTIAVTNGSTLTSSSIFINGGTVATDGSVVVGNVSTGIALAALAAGSEIDTPFLDLSGTSSAIEASAFTVAGTGDITVANQASMQAEQTLTLLALTPSGTSTAHGGLRIVLGGAIEIGGSSGAAPDSLLIDKGGLLVGFGVVDSKITGTAAATGLPQYSLTLDNLGTIEAEGGTLQVHANFTADGTALIDDAAALEIGGSFAEGGTVDFQSLTTGTLVLDNLADFHGGVVGLADDQDPSAGAATAAGVMMAILSADTIGSKFIVHNAPATSAFRKAFVTEGTLAGQGTYELQINLTSNAEGTITLPDTTAALAHDFFFKVTPSGTSDVVLSYTAGNPIDRSVDGPTARKTYGVTGSGITIGITSNGFDTGQLSSDKAIGALPNNVNVFGRGLNDEGRAMAQIVHDIAPGATIDFVPDGSDADSVAAAIAQLQSLHCNVIVDDVALIDATGTKPMEARVGSPVEKAILDAVVNSHITYVTSAGNYRSSGTPIFGHALDPHVITVAAMNWLATPTSSFSVGGYLPTQTELSSSIGPAGMVAKPNITAPDGGPTTLPLDDGGLSPFFGTSAAAPAVAAIAALMLQANRQLKPADISSMLQLSATPFGEPFNMGGAGLAEAYQAVGLAKLGLHNFYVDPPLGTLHVASAYLSQPAGDVESGATLQVFVTMSSGVTVSGTPALALNDGGSAVYDAAASDPANASLVFNYAPGAETAVNLAITGVVANGAIVQDASANVADFSGLFGVASGLSVNSPLHVTSAAASRSGEIAAGDTVQLSLTLSSGAAVVTTGGPPILDLNNGATAAYDGALSNLAGGTLVFDYVVGSADAIPELSVFDVTLPAGTTVQDAAGNNANFSAALSQSLGVQVDPSFVNLFGVNETGAIATGGTAQLSITMTTPIAVDTSGGAPMLALNDGETATYDAAASDPSAGKLVFDNVVQAGDQVPDLQVTHVVLNGAVLNDPHGAAADLSGALDYPTGLTVNSPIAVTSVVPSQSGTIGVGQTVTLSLALNGTASVAGIDNPLGPPTLTLDDGAAATYDAATSTATSLAFDYVVQAGDYSPDLTIVSVNANGNPIQDALGNNVNFAAATGSATGVAVVACFAAGTRIATVRGEVAVEALRVGDLVCVVGPHSSPSLCSLPRCGREERGIAVQPVVSLRHRRIDCARHPQPERVWPVRVRAHAFGVGRPHRDLWLSPDHAVFRDGVLVPIKYLIDDEHVMQEAVAKIEYWHVELPRHDALLAEGLAAESYLDTSDARPDIAWEAYGCAPLAIVAIAASAASTMWGN